MIWITQLYSNILNKNYVNYLNIEGTTNKEKQNLTINSLKICDIETELYDKIQIYKKVHRSISKGIYMYGFTNHMNEYQPSGSLNMSLMDNIQLHIKTNNNMISHLF
jgi:anaerobic ribonucleoside-triphosphate reductase